MDEATRAQRRAELFSLLGDLPDRHRPIGAVSVERRPADHYELERLVLDLNGAEHVPAYLVKPPNAPGPLPVVLYNHWHGGQYDVGKDELLNANPGQRAHGGRPYAQELTRMGYAVLCIDQWGFGERATRTESDLFKHMLWDGRVMWGMMVYDGIRALDYLCSRPDIDPARIGTMGMSMGSTMAWWLAALDERIKVCIDVCCLTDFQALIDADNLKGHGLYYYVPALLKHFTASQINQLIVPRPHLSVAGNLDPLTPPTGLDRIDRELTRAYASAGAANSWRLHREAVKHEETPTMRREILAFLKKWL